MLCCMSHPKLSKDKKNYKMQTPPHHDLIHHHCHIQCHKQLSPCNVYSQQKRFVSVGLPPCNTCHPLLLLTLVCNYSRPANYFNTRRTFYHKQINIHFKEEYLTL